MRHCLVERFQSANYCNFDLLINYSGDTVANSADYDLTYGKRETLVAELDSAPCDFQTKLLNVRTGTQITMLGQIDRQTEAKLLERIDTTKLESHVDAFVRRLLEFVYFL